MNVTKETRKKHNGNAIAETEKRSAPTEKKHKLKREIGRSVENELAE